jgi:hypothetical protein
MFKFYKENLFVSWRFDEEIYGIKSMWEHEDEKGHSFEINVWKNLFAYKSCLNFLIIKYANK